jgi:hypothetical protein
MAAVVLFKAASGSAGTKAGLPPNWRPHQAGRDHERLGRTNTNPAEHDASAGASFLVFNLI